MNLRDLNINAQKSQNESLQLEEAQARFELKELKRTLDEELDRREKEHEEQIQLLEKVIVAELNEIKPIYVKSRIP